MGESAMECSAFIRYMGAKVQVPRWKIFLIFAVAFALGALYMWNCNADIETLKEQIDDMEMQLNMIRDRHYVSDV